RLNHHRKPKQHKCMNLTAFAISHGECRRLAKLFRIMKLTSILLLAACLHLAARSNGQTVSLSFKNAPLKKVFIAIQKQTGLNLFMDESLLRNSGKVSIDAHNISVNRALEHCLEGSNLDFRIDAGAIVVRK